MNIWVNDKIMNQSMDKELIKKGRKTWTNDEYIIWVSECIENMKKWTLEWIYKERDEWTSERTALWTSEGVKEWINEWKDNSKNQYINTGIIESMSNWM